MKLIMKLTNEWLNGAISEVISRNPQQFHSGDIIYAYESGFRKAREMAAEKAKHWGYTFDYNAEYAPWAEQANSALRVQNAEIAKEIRKLGEEEVD
jgi:hypothetical protein